MSCFPKNVILYVRCACVALPVLMFAVVGQSTTRVSSVAFPHVCVSVAYHFDPVVGSSQRSTPRCTTAGPELPEPAYGVREILTGWFMYLEFLIAGIPTLIRPWFG